MDNEPNQSGSFPETRRMGILSRDAKKLTLVNKDSKTHNEDVTESTYKLDGESLVLEYESGEKFTFIRMKKK